MRLATFVLLVLFYLGKYFHTVKEAGEESWKNFPRNLHVMGNRNTQINHSFTEWLSMMLAKKAQVSPHYRVGSFPFWTPIPIACRNLDGIKQCSPQCSMCRILINLNDFTKAWLSYWHVCEFTKIGLQPEARTRLEEKLILNNTLHRLTCVCLKDPVTGKCQRSWGLMILEVSWFTNLTLILWKNSKSR